MRIPCPKCQFELDESATECPRCGIVLAHFKPLEASASSVQPAACDSVWKEWLFPEIMDSNPLYTAARALTWCVLAYLSVRFMAAGVNGAYIGSSFMHLVNLPFHEAGHVFFRPLGRFMTSLGGSLGQLLVPLICLTALVFKTRDAFGGAVCLWWFGQNFVDLAPYINDARSLSLPLLGGNVGKNAPYGFHDWEFILKESGLQAYDHALAKSALGLGGMLMTLALLWGGIEIWRQYRDLREM